MTLIELMVTLSVAAILFSLAIPSFRQMAATSRVAGLTNELTATLSLARSEAVKRGTTVTVCKSADTDTAIDNTTNPTTGPTCLVSSDSTIGWEAGWLVFVDNNADGVVGATEIRLKVGQPAVSDAEIDGGGLSDDHSDGNFDRRVTYFPSGVSRGNGGLPNGTLNLCSPPNQRDITISSTGRIRVEKPAAPCS